LVKTDQGGEEPSNVQVGIASFLDSSVNASYPNGFTRVSEVVDWVKETVCERKGELCKPQSKSSKVSKSGKVSKSAKETPGDPKYPDTCAPVSTFAPTFMPTTESPTITAKPVTPHPTWAPKEAAVNTWVDKDVNGVIDHQADILRQCQTRSYDLGLYAIPGPHFFIGATAIDDDKEASLECPAAIAFASVDATKKIFKVNENTGDIAKYTLGKFELGYVLEAEEKAMPIQGFEYDIQSNNCAHYAADIWRSLGVKETPDLADFLVSNIVNSDEIIDITKEKAGGHRVLAALAVGGHGAFEYYWRNVVASQLNIE
jgi:hypothetical protein